MTNTIPSEGGYQAELMSQMGAFQERIVSTVDGSVTSVQAIYVPSDDVTDPGVQVILPYMQSMVILSRAVAEQGIYPAVDVFNSTSSIMTADTVGEEHYNAVLQTQVLLNKYTELSHMVAIIGESELSAEQRTDYNRAKKVINYMSQPFFVAEAQTGVKGHYVARETTVKDVLAIMSGAYDDVPEGDFRNIGDLETLGGKESAAEKAVLAEQEAKLAAAEGGAAAPAAPASSVPSQASSVQRPVASKEGSKEVSSVEATNNESAKSQAAPAAAAVSAPETRDPQPVAPVPPSVEVTNNEAVKNLAAPAAAAASTVQRPVASGQVANIPSPGAVAPPETRNPKPAAAAQDGEASKDPETQASKEVASSQTANNPSPGAVAPVASPFNASKVEPSAPED
jgi:hypothetical protein